MPGSSGECVASRASRFERGRDSDQACWCIRARHRMASHTNASIPAAPSITQTRFRYGFGPTGLREAFRSSGIPSLSEYRLAASAAALSASRRRISAQSFHFRRISSRTSRCRADRLSPAIRASTAGLVISSRLKRIPPAGERLNGVTLSVVPGSSSLITVRSITSSTRT